MSNRNYIQQRISIYLSLSAIIISGLTAYRLFYYEKMDLRASLRLMAEKDAPWELDMTFFNVGTEWIEVYELVYRIDHDLFTSGNRFGEFDNLLIEPGKIVQHRIHLTEIYEKIRRSLDPEFLRSQQLELAPVLPDIIFTPDIRKSIIESGTQTVLRLTLKFTARDLSGRILKAQFEQNVRVSYSQFFGFNAFDMGTIASPITTFAWMSKN